MSVKTLVALPAEKKRKRRRQKPINNVTVKDWDSLNKRECSTLFNYQLVIACPHIAEFITTVLGNEAPAAEALRSYLQAKGKRGVIFLVPTERYILKQPYDYMLGQYSGIVSEEQWRENPRKAWETIILPRTLTLIETCIGRKVWFGDLEPPEDIEPTTTGKAAKLLSRYLDRRAPKSPPYEIIVSEKTTEGVEAEDIDDVIPEPPGRWNHNNANCAAVEPLACYEFSDYKYAAVKVTMERGGVAILLPFDGRNVTKDDVKLLLRLYAALQESPPEGEKQVIAGAETGDIEMAEAVSEGATGSSLVAQPIESFSPPSPEVPEVSEVIMEAARIVIVTPQGKRHVIKAKYGSNPRRAAELLIKQRLYDSHGPGYLTVPKDQKIERLTYNTLRTAVSELNIKPGICCGVKFFRSARSNSDAGYEGWRFEPAPSFGSTDAAEDKVAPVK